MAASRTMLDKGRIILIITLLLLNLFPLYWLVITSLKSPREIIRPVPSFFPEVITLDNYRAVFMEGIGQYFVNSLVVTVLGVGLSLILAFSASYALVRYKFPWKFNSIFLIWVLMIKILPPMVLSVPLYQVFLNLKLINTHLGLILVYQMYTLPYALWILVGFIKKIPLEIEQAAAIDGASPQQILLRIIVPLSTGGIVATGIFSAIMVWDEFLFALLFIRKLSMFTLPLRISSYITEYETHWGQLMAIGVLASLPMLFLCRFVYEKLTKGFSPSLK